MGRVLFFISIASAMILGCGSEEVDYRSIPLEEPGAASKSSTDATKKSSTTNSNSQNKSTNDNANNDTPADPAEEDPANAPEVQLSFAADVAPLFRKSCVGAGCHSQASRVGLVEVETFNGARQAFAASLAAIKGGTMPIGNYPKLSADEILQLEQWEKQGFKP